MREIKFRAWDKEYNLMIPSNDIHPRVMNELITGEGKVLEIYERNSYLGTDISYEDISDKRILMQYTGLIDKNGKEIYEGDIVEERWSNPLAGGENVDRYEITFAENGVYKMRHSSGEDRWNRTLFLRFKEVTVIGNIYEHSELMKS